MVWRLWTVIAVHTASRALQRHDCDMSLAEEVVLMFNEQTNCNNHKSGFLSSDGLCCTFDSIASGYLRGKGGGAVLIKRLSDAKRDGDTVYGIVRGSSMQHNGRGASFAAPTITSQEALIRAALGS